MPVSINENVPKYLQEIIGDFIFGNEQQRAQAFGKLDLLRQMCREMGYKEPIIVNENTLEYNFDVALIKEELN